MSTSQGAIHSLEGMKDRLIRTQILIEINLPVLLVAGSEDKIIPPEKTFYVNQSNISQLLIEEAGLMSMVEAPGKLIKGIKNFIHK